MNNPYITTIGSLFPNVERIEIDYELAYRGAILAEKTVHGGMTILPKHRDDIRIRCLNNDCTEQWFDLYSAVAHAIAHKETHANGEIRCGGREAHDHPEQPCGTTLRYQIEISYRPQTRHRTPAGRE